MYKRKNIFYYVYIMTTFIFLLTSCTPGGGNVQTSAGLGDENVTAPGELPIVKEKITLTIAKPATPNIIDFDTNEYTKWLEEQTGIDLEFVLFPSGGGDAMTKLEIMLASNTQLPDLIMGMNFSDSFFQKHADSGVFADLTDYIDNNGFWTNRMFEETIVPNLRKFMTSADGNTYFMPYLTEQTGNIWPGKCWINQTWLDNLGLDIPETTEDFENVLRAFKNGDPNGNGLADEIPLTGTKDGYQQVVPHFLMNAFIYCDQSNYYTVNNGVVDVAYNKEEWRNGLRYMSNLVKEGLLDINSLIQDGNTFKSLVLNPSANIVGCFPAQGPDAMLDMPERMGEYVGMPPLKGPKGASYTFVRPWNPATYGVITKYCKNPLAAFRLMDFMLGEESALRARYGIPGVDWEEATETDKCMFESIGAKPFVKAILPYSGVQNSHWQSMHPTFRSQAVSDGMIWDGNTLDVEYIKAVALPLYMDKGPKEYVEKQLFTEQESDEMTALESSIKNYVKENIGMFIASEKNLDADWNSYITELEKMGLKRYIELSQAGYDRFNKQEG